MGELLEKKAFWIPLIILFALLIGALIFGLVMDSKYKTEEEEETEETEVEVKTVQPNNTFLAFCNDDSLYALDANYSTNPIVNVQVTQGGSVKEISDTTQINAIWESLKAMTIADASSVEVTPAEYTITLHRNMGSDVTVTFQSDALLTFNNVNYDIADAAGFFDEI